MAIVSNFPEKRGLNADDINDIAGGEISNGFVQSQFNYSTDEQVIGKWVDGKPLYQKTINFGALPNNTTKVVSLGISNVDRFAEIIGVSMSSEVAHHIPHVYGAETNENALALNKVNGVWTATIYTHTDRTNFTAYITVRYTKTTD